MSQCLVEDTNIETEFPTEPSGVSRSLYYGWIMLPMSMATMIASSPGQTFGVSVFNEPMRLSLGLSHGQLAMAYMLGTLLGAVPITWITPPTWDNESTAKHRQEHMFRRNRMPR